MAISSVLMSPMSHSFVYRPLLSFRRIAAALSILSLYWIAWRMRDDSGVALRSNGVWPMVVSLMSRPASFM